MPAIVSIWQLMLTPFGYCSMWLSQNTVVSRFSERV